MSIINSQSSRKVLLQTASILLLLLALQGLDFQKAEELNALNFLPASRLIKSVNDATVYYISPNGFKIPIPSAEVFLSYGAKWEEIELVDQQELDFYKNAEFIKQIKPKKTISLDEISDNLTSLEFKLKPGTDEENVRQKLETIFKGKVILKNREQLNAHRET